MAWGRTRSETQARITRLTTLSSPSGKPLSTTAISVLFLLILKHDGPHQPCTHILRLCINIYPFLLLSHTIIYSGAHNSISGLGNSHSIPSVLLSCISSSVHSLGRLLPTTIKLRMAKECCAGVMYLHSKNIMHCDIKSLNFLGKISFLYSFVSCFFFLLLFF